ncbi:hypothetical protein LN050_04920 [Comamonadaceae bacterium M7527]|nr:hypothetical protein LN050_04920 [Comamonadaceae bacterium M7527]
MQTLIRVMSIAAISVASLLGGCANNYGSVPPADGAGSASTAPAARVADDFPIPAGSVIDTEQTLVLGEGANWTGRLVLNLGSDAQSAFVFFRDQGKAFGWQLIAASYGKASLLTFTKAQRSATVYIEDSFRGATATVTVGPVAAKGV